jgi:hypothetical protein
MEDIFEIDDIQEKLKRLETDDEKHLGKEYSSFWYSEFV